MNRDRKSIKQGKNMCQTGKENREVDNTEINFLSNTDRKSITQR